MKKMTLAIGLLFFATGGIIAQDLKKAKNTITLSSLPGAGPNKLEDAKVEVDKLVVDAKGKDNAEVWLLKSQVYGMMAANSTLKTKYTTASAEALTALKRYLELEPQATKIAEQGFLGLNDIYKSFFDEGVKNYNNKTWEEAYNNFSKLIEVGDIMITKKWTNTVFDTTAYLFAGIAAQNFNKEAEATKYYTQIADRKIKGQDYEHIYVFLPNYYSTLKQDDNFKKYIAISKEVYPEKKFWTDIEFEHNTGTAGLEDVAKQYDAANTSNSLSARQYFDYGNFFVSDKKVKEAPEAEKLKFLQKSVEAFIKSAELDSTNTLAFYNAGVTTFSLWEDAADKASQIKGITADIKTKRAAADKIADAAADKSIIWLEKAYLKIDAKATKDKIEVNSQKSAAKFLSNLLIYKRDKAKGNDAAYDRFDKKFKFYDTKY